MIKNILRALWGYLPYLLGGILVLVVIGYLYFLLVLKPLARLFEPLVMRYLDWRWKPRHPPVFPGPGARLELVITPNKLATVGWQMTVFTVKYTVLSLSLVFLIVSLMPAINIVFFSAAEITQSTYMPSILVGYLLVTTVAMLCTYWFYEWKRRYQRVVVFTDEIYMIRADPAWLGLLPLPFLKSQRPFTSGGPTSYLIETKTAADVEDLGKYHTSWLRDLWTERLSEIQGVGSIFLPSEIIFAEDTIQWVDDHIGTKECLVNIGRIGKVLEQRRSTSVSVGTSEGLRLPEISDWSPEAAMERIQEVEDKFTEMYPSTSVGIDPISAVDPGIWNRKTGQLIVEETRQDPARIHKLFTGS